MTVASLIYKHQCLHKLHRKAAHYKMKLWEFTVHTVLRVTIDYSVQNDESLYKWEKSQKVG